MPSYQYRCVNPDCEEERFTVLKRMSESEELELCPRCGEPCERDYANTTISGRFGDTPHYGRKT